MIRDADSVSSLKHEISLNRDFVSLDEEVFLAFVYTWQRFLRLGSVFFQRYGISDAQFNVLMILWDYRNRALHQHELAEIILVNRASIGALIDRMTATGLVERMQDPEDRRANYVRITTKGAALLKKVKTPYYSNLFQVFAGFSTEHKKALLDYFARFRRNIQRLAAQRKPMPVKET
jgi:DNA-binding MarR family transcriptional regulator